MSDLESDRAFSLHLLVFGAAGPKWKRWGPDQKPGVQVMSRGLVVWYQEEGRQMIAMFPWSKVQEMRLDVAEVGVDWNAK